MKKFRWYYDKDAEEVWLNEMANQGWALQGYFLGIYTFSPCEPGEYIYQIDLMPSDAVKAREFTEFMEDSGVEVVDRWNQWAYLRKEAQDGGFELYTDMESRIGQYKRISSFFKRIILVEIIVTFIELNAAIQTGVYFFGVLTLLFVLLLIVLLRIMWKCQWRIEELEKRKF
jgi:hypothetical protein